MASATAFCWHSAGCPRTTVERGIPSDRRRCRRPPPRARPALSARVVNTESAVATLPTEERRRPGRGRSSRRREKKARPRPHGEHCPLQAARGRSSGRTQSWRRTGPATSRSRTRPRQRSPPWPHVLSLPRRRRHRPSVPPGRECRRPASPPARRTTARCTTARRRHTGRLCVQGVEVAAEAALRRPCCAWLDRRTACPVVE